VKTPLDKLLIRGLRRFSLEQPLNKRLHETGHNTAYCTCCGTLTCLTDNRTAVTIRSRSHNTTACAAGDTTFL
jgi:hypothetical protein